MKKQSKQNIRGQINKSPKKIRNSLIWFAAAAGIILLAIFSIFVQKSPALDTKLSAEIPVSQAYKLYEAGTFILDVRQPEEYSAAHIPGAKLIPLGELNDRITEVPRDENIIVVCRSGNRSATGRDILFNAGYPQVTSMAGGMNEWINSGYKTKIGIEQ